MHTWVQGVGDSDVTKKTQAPTAAEIRFKSKLVQV